MKTAKTTSAALAAFIALPLLASGAAADAAPATGEEGIRDSARNSGWIAWFGCWEAADDVQYEGGNLLVCFEPVDDGDGVEIRTLVDGEVLALERFVADGVPVPAAEGGCEGDRTARWSSDGSRVFVSSELACAEGVTRSSSGVMALTRNGSEWLEIHSVEAGNRQATVGVRRFVPASRDALELHGVEPYGTDLRLAVTTARAQASAPLSHAAVAELVDEAGADVTRALIAETGNPFALDARSLKELRAAGVPADVLDVMVAVTYPERFEIEGASWHAEAASPVLPQERARADWPVTRRGYSPWAMGWYGWSGFGYSRMGYGLRAYDPYWQPYWGPRIVVVHPTVRDRQRSVHPDRGYTSSGASNRSATRSGQQGQPATSRIPTASRGSGGARVTPQGRTGSTSGGDARRATRRSGGDSGSGGGG